MHQGDGRDWRSEHYILLRSYTNPGAVAVCILIIHESHEESANFYCRVLMGAKLYIDRLNRE